MKPPKPHGRTVKIIGIKEPKNIQRFEHFIKKSFRCESVEDLGNYVVTHLRIHDVRPVDVIVYTSNKIYITGSPLMHPDTFNRIATKVAEIAQESVTGLVKERPITLQRAGGILEFASKLNPDDEFERMVIVILADTSNEIVLTEKMKALEIKGTPLEEGVPTKIEYIKKKGKNVYRESEIKNIRALRNDIVHHGNIPLAAQARESLKIALDVLENA